MTNSSTSSSIHPNVVPSEVGWQFVPQYYTFVNKQPNRLHCFYTKASTFIHGTEGEDGKPCYGQQEIHAKITSIGFEDCRVFIHSVDAQSSANGGIIIQVIGEMSNHSDPWRKFVQTFFLAEQPNGYFVLNDIFRFLKEEAVESDDASEAEPAPAPEVKYSALDIAREPVPAPAPQIYDSQPEPAPAPPPAPVEELSTTIIPEPIAPAPPLEPSTQPNGIHNADPEPAPATPASVEASPVPEAAIELAPSPSPPPAATLQLAAPSAAATPAQPPSQPAPQQAPVSAPAPINPAGRKTWAALAATDHKKWGPAFAQDSRGTSELPAQSSSPGPGSGAHTPAAGHGPGAGRGSGPHPPRDHHSPLTQVQNITTAQCFVKGVIEPVTQAALTSVLTSRFGPIKEIDIVRNKACAFLEFTHIEAAKKAIIASLPHSQGGEGGIRIDVGGEAGQVRISVETKRERNERPMNRPRPQSGGEGRGGYRGRGGPGGGRGRGGPPQPAKGA